MSTNGPGLQELATQIACALAEALFPAPDASGRPVASLDQAHVIASGRLDLWDAWPSQPERVHRLVGRFLRIRHNELGSHRRFMQTARDLAHRPDSPYTVPGGVPLREVRQLVPRHGQQPLDLAERLIAEAEAKHLQNRRPLPVATRGRWSFGPQAQSVVEFPDLGVPVTNPLVVKTAPSLKSLMVAMVDLFDLADELDAAGGGSPWQRRVLEGLCKGLKNTDDIAVSELLLRAGRIQLLNAPTGVGKSVLTRLLAIHLARRGVPVAIVVGTINEAQKTAETLQEQDDNARQTARALNSDLAALGSRLRCATLISPHRLHEKAVIAASREDWDRYDRLAYGCALPALLVDGPPPQPGNEPCTALWPSQAQADSNARASKPQRHACPRLNMCDRHRGLRDAATADIIVTNHHNLIHGTVPVPVRVDDVDYGRIGVLEFLLRRCQVLVIDEVDRFQSNMFDSGAREVVLSANTGISDLPLAQLNAQRAMLLPADDRNVLPALSRTVFLADQFLNYVLEGDLWLDERERRSGAGWHLPGANDRLLLLELFGVDQATDTVPLETYEQFNAIFPDSPDSDDVKLPNDLRKVAELLRTVVSNDAGIDHIREVKSELHARLARRLPDRRTPRGGEPTQGTGQKDNQQQDTQPTGREVRREVANALLVRTWLGALHQALNSLTYAVGSPATELPAARTLIEQLGTFVQHAAIPYGPLGYLLFGFRIDRVGDGVPRGQLSVQAIAGDPHTTTVQLGDIVALAAAGVRRIALGLSATAYFPGAAREHLHAEPTYAMTDAAEGAFTTLAGQALNAEFQPFSVGGQLESRKPEVIQDIGQTLWEQRLDPHLRQLAASDPDRELCLLIGNSYNHAAFLAAGIARAVPDPSWVAVVVPKDDRPAQVPLPNGIIRITVEDLEDLPRTHPAVKVCTAPLSLVARGLNILVPGDHRSALSSIWVCVRPVIQLNAPAEILASVNACALGEGAPGPDPALILSQQVRAAYRRLHTLLSIDPRFSRLPRHLKAEAVAGMLVDLIQLAGRARRGGTRVELYLVDNAFHDSTLGSDLPSLLRFYYDNLTADQQQALRRIYGSTLGSWLEFAGIDPTRSLQENR